MLAIIKKANLGRDAVLSTTPTGKSVLKFNVAEQIGWGDHKSTSWWSCVLWGPRAVSLAPYLKKGMAVMVIGEASLRKYTTKAGVEKEQLDINVDEIEMFSSVSRQGETETAKGPLEDHADSPPQKDSFAAFGYTTMDEQDVPF